MYVKLLCLFSVVLAADGAILSGECPYVKNPVEPDLDKLSGLWYVVGTTPNGDDIIWSTMWEFNRDGVNYTVTFTFLEHTTRTYSEQLVLGVDEGNRKMIKSVPNNERLYISEGSYLLGAEYDNFSILYTCYMNDYNIVPTEVVIVLSRSKDVEEDTRNKIKNVLQEYPQLKELKDKFD